MRPQRAYLDACIFIALYNPQREDADVISGIREVFSEIEQGRLYAVTSSVTIGELLDDSHEILMNRFNGIKGEILDVTRPIMVKARAIRKRLVRATSGAGKKNLDLIDCIHLASAHISGCDFFVTTDGYGNNKLSTLGSAEILLNEFNLRVCAPMNVVDQRTFNLTQEDSTDFDETD